MVTITFQIDYHTVPGESLHVGYRINGGEEGRTALSTDDGKTWTGKLRMPEGDTALSYAYLVKRDGRIVRRERADERHFVPSRRSRVTLADRWTEREIPAYMYHSAFTRCVFRRSGCAPIDVAPLSEPYLLLLRALPPSGGRRWAVTGSTASLGEWRSVRPLVRTGVYEWGIPLSRADFATGGEYKFVLTDDTRPEEIVWEEGANRRLPVLAPADGDGAVLTDDAPRIAMRPWRGAGVVIPVFSLRSEGSQGVGDFGDLSTLARHAPRAGLAAIQILPVGDTTSTGTWRDSYPYNGISVFALHPIYFDMRRHRASAAYARHAGRAAELNRLPALDYEAVFALKTAFLHDLYTETGTAVERSTEYRRFVAEEAYWLAPYARYSLRKAEEQGRSTEGGEAFYRFVQYGLHRQLSAAHEIARRAGVILKGDIPIGICRDSVDAETYPALFHMDGQAGAPPDAFARLGQNWGFPTYDWEAMSADGYGWWRKRLAHMNRYFDAFRIDHVLGFFRIWEVPADQAHGLLGRFRPALPLSEEEIRQAGFGPSPAYYATPRITEAALLSAERDGELKAIRRYLDREADGTYVLRPEVGTQRRIEHALPPGALRTALMNLCTEVLFIPDPDRPGHYHPRIAAGDTEAFRSLSPADREAWGRLHDDFFYRRHDAFWAEQAMRKLPAILSRSSAAEHHMLPCAEDLGMVPASVKGVLERLEVLSLEIQRMPKRYGVRFDRVEDNPYLSVATIATHDMPPLRLWWKQDGEQTAAFYREVLHRPAPAPAEATPEVCETVVAQHLESPSMLCLLALQDWLSIDPLLRAPHPEEEQINDPANADQYWNYRMHITMERLFADTAFAEKLRTLIARSGRSF